MNTSVDDLNRWLRHLESGLEQGDSVVVDMHRRGRLTNGIELRYGSGLVHSVINGHEIVQHGGRLGPFNSLSLRIPRHRLALAMLSNANELQPFEYWSKIVDALVGASEPTSHSATTVEASKPTSAGKKTNGKSTGADTIDPVRVTGLYRDPGSAVFEVSHNEDDAGSLWVAPWQGDKLRLIQTDELTFTIEGLPNIITFAANDNGNIDRYIVRINGYEEPARVRIPRGPARSALTDYAGNYYSTELQVMYGVDVHNDGLTMSHIQFGTLKLQHIASDYFGTALGDWLPTLIHFDSNHANEISGLSVSSEWSSDVRFLRIELP